MITRSADQQGRDTGPAIRAAAPALANAGRGLGKAFLDQHFDDVRHVIDASVNGPLYLIHKVGQASSTEPGSAYKT